MADLTERDIGIGQVWRDAGTPHLWRVTMVLREHLIGDIYETTVWLMDEFDHRDRMRTSGGALLKDFELESGNA